MSVLPLKPKTVLNGRYEIVELLGQGGFGKVYLVFDKNLERKCVVKEFIYEGICERNSLNNEISVPNENIELMEILCDNFENEALNIKKIRDEGVINVTDIWRENGTVYYVMDLIEGDELPKPDRKKDDKSPKTERKKWKSMRWKKAKKIAVALLKSLHAIHNVGLIHGDIKPENILIAKNGSPVLIDFGAARPINEPTMIMMYTSGYAPIELEEQTRSGEANSSSDLYSWAMIVIGLIKNHSPIDVKKRIKTFSETNQDPYSKDSLTKLLPSSLPEEIIAILADCLLLDPKKRPQSAKNVWEKINKIYGKTTILDPKGHPQFAKENTNKNYIKATLVLGIVSITIIIVAIGLFITELMEFLVTTELEKTEESVEMSQLEQLNVSCLDGEMNTCVRLGNMYENGLQTPQNYEEAIRFYQMACNNENMLGCNNLGNRYFTEREDLKNNEKAFRLFEIACGGGNVNGCYNLIVIYVDEIEMIRNYEKVAMLYQITCDDGDLINCNNLGNMYRIGMLQNDEEASRLYQIACEGENVHACHNLYNLCCEHPMFRECNESL